MTTASRFCTTLKKSLQGFQNFAIHDEMKAKKGSVLSVTAEFLIFHHKFP
jgi:hypothetical protein